jgi:hypothetical protein
VEDLQRSAFELLDRLLPTAALTAPVALDAEEVCFAPVA